MDELDIRAEKARRRFLKTVRIILIIILIWGIITFFLYRYTDSTFYLTRGSRIKTGFVTDKTGFRMVRGREETPFIFKGTELAEVYPDGNYEAYLGILSEIRNAGANCVRVHELMPPEFYRALKDLNKSGSILLLIQGVELPEKVFNDMSDMVSGGLVDKFGTVSRLTVDAVHGNKSTLGYKTNVSNYIAAYILGEKWNSDLAIYTNYLYDNRLDNYNGKYVIPWESANASTKLIAQAMDNLYEYETKKYSMQHPVGIGNNQRTDCMPHTSDWAVGVNENLTAIQTASLSPGRYAKAGIFAAYRIETGVMQNLSFDPNFITFVDGNGVRNPLEGYMKAIVENHYYMSVMLGGSCVSAARGCSGIDEILGFDRGGIGEAAQAEALSFIYNSAIEAGMCGGCIGCWSDDQYATADNNDIFTEHNGNWIDVQDSEAALGISAIEPDSIFCPDGDRTEWKNVEPVIKKDGFIVKAGLDAAYLHLCVRIPQYNSVTDVVYIPFDIAPFLGTKECDNQQLDFSHPVEFLLTINGSRRARLVVQEYYSIVQNLYDEIGKKQFWFTEAPERDSAYFIPVYQFVREKLSPADASDIEPVYNETGVLKYGNANPESDSYDSLACYCIKGNYIELRIPWALLNFADPSDGSICNDFYVNGIGTEHIESFFAGLMVYRNGELTDLGFGEISMADYNGAVKTRLREAAGVF